jgi:hypothetical protein
MLVLGCVACGLDYSFAAHRLLKSGGASACVVAAAMWWIALDMCRTEAALNAASEIESCALRSRRGAVGDN